MCSSHHRKSTVHALVAALAVAGLVSAACGNTSDSRAEQTGEDPSGGAATSQRGELAPPDKADNAFTYDEQLAPAGAELMVTAHGTATTSRVELEVKGLLPDRGYAVHAHTNPCGADGDAAGPHFQHEEDPAASPGNPSTDPQYANPKNEVWLELATDGGGAGTAKTEVPFAFAGRAPASVVVHAEESTATGEGEAGKAGDRVACLTVTFD